MSFKEQLKKHFPMSWKGWGVFVAAMGVASLTCGFLRTTTSSDTHVPLIFVLAVLVVAYFTEGYFYGFISAIVSVFAVNWAFTYPYMNLDFTIYGYPLTFMTMLAVGFAVSTLTTRLKSSEKLKAEAEREKTRANLLRAVSHDLRTPLTSISGSLGVVLDSGGQLDNSEVRQLLYDAKKDAEWLYSMVENLLSVTRMSNTRNNEITKQEELLEEIISETVINFRKRRPEISVAVSMPEDPVFVPMDSMLIEQVLFNLLDNAATHGEITDSISVVVSYGEDIASVAVRDNGVGIYPEFLSSLFDGTMPLSKNDENRFMGIGLSVCKTIIDAHGGGISARNLPEGGAEFCFTLPLD